MEAICSSETSIDFQRSTRRYTAEDGTLFITTAMRTSDPTIHSFFNVANMFSFISKIFILKIILHASSPYLPAVQDRHVYSAIVPHDLQ
jgi:hypothetical protein